MHIPNLDSNAIQTKIIQYNRLMHSESFFEAHEVMEEIWHFLKSKKHPLSNLAKGLTNAAISFEHLKRDRKRAIEKAIVTMSSFDRHKGLLMPNNEFFAEFSTCISYVENLKTKNSNIF